MSLESIYYVGQTVAVVAIVGSLLAVFFQLRQASKQIRESNSQARAEFSHRFGSRSADLQLAWFGTDGPNKTMMKALLTADRLTHEEQFEFGVQMAIFFGTLNESELFNQRGLLDDEVARLRRQIYGPYLSFPRVRKWWERQGQDFYLEAGVSELVEKMMAEGDSWQMLRERPKS